MNPTIEEIEERWEMPNADDLDWNDAKDDIQRLIQGVKNLEADLALNKSMLAHQTNLAREAEPRTMKLETSMIKHFQDEHLAGDGPEIDRWKKKVKDLEAELSEWYKKAEAWRENHNEP